MFAALCASSALAITGPGQHSPAQPLSTESIGLDEAAKAVVDIRVKVLADGRSLKELGKERRGSGVVIDEMGHVLTSVYLVLEADDIEVISRNGASTPARLVASDFESGIAILKLDQTLPVESLELGSAASIGVNEPAVTISSNGSAQLVAVTYVVAKRPYHTGWEFALDEAIFTQPTFAGWNGAGLVNERGELIGIGSLLIHASGRPAPEARRVEALGTMFVPIDEIRPVLDELIASGRRNEPERPWIGVLTRQLDDRCEITSVLPDSPAEVAGLEERDVIVAINSKKIETQLKLYEALWDSGPAGVSVTLTIRRGTDLLDFEIRSVGLSSYYRVDSEN